ncbi:Alpha/Beta hydrolase protein [Massariosphaeria phaeospora]|uniref:Carboxylic ester hydrolase n=1 Tax=Massariosphaeria phaeospora TaxID=100035 RepID=A0A7C8IJR0_9PLEO|nr:Alpha/Beta hydrolase protein [Massariosphaeria phaeospora]
MKRIANLIVSAVALLSPLNGKTGVGAEPIPTARALPTIDLGYAIYEGAYDAGFDVNTFKGIRYAAPPVGNLRFAAPQAPATNRTSTTPATTDVPVCPQSGAGAETPAKYGFVSAPGNEDCLFLNVFAPAIAKDLPVFVWIHGGGYGLFSAAGIDPTEFMKTNGNNFVSVIINYRLGAFGFLSGDDVREGGALNAGLLDMNFALEWVQKYIGKFGGDPARVTIGGESAGAAAVVYQAMAYGGEQDKTLFNNIISASPWFPNQHGYNDTIPTKAYNDFADAAGCGDVDDTLQCLRDAESSVLQKASAKVSEASTFGSFAFLPVTDEDFVQKRPTEQLNLSGSLKGKRILTGNMANEGVPLSPPTAKTLSAFRAYVSTTFPSFSSADKAALEGQYAYDGDDRDTDPSASLFETTGTSCLTAVNQSSFATGQQQRVFNVFAESTFACPSYWAASAFPEAWRYQYSVSPGYHGFDLTAYWSKGARVPGNAFKHAFQKIWGTFITANTPVISVDDARGGVANATVPVGASGNINWPQWSEANPVFMNLNATGGVPKFVNVTENLKYFNYLEPGVTNRFSLAEGRSWEGGRGERCSWWRAQGAKVPY